MLLLVCPEDARGADDIYDVTFDISGTCNTDADDDLVWNETQGRLGVGTATPGQTLDVDGSAVFNESGADADFRVEGDTEPNLLFVDASTGRVGVGTATPEDTLHVEGDLSVYGTAKVNAIAPYHSMYVYIMNLRVEGDNIFVPDGAIIGVGDISTHFVFDHSARLIRVVGADLGLDSTKQVQFNGTTEFINQGAAGHLDLHADTSIDLNQNVDVTGNITVSGTVDGVDVSAIPTTYMPLAGGTFTGDVTLAGAPTADLHAATKKYVDDELSAGGGVLSKVLIDTYLGNDWNDREIDLGDDYDEVHIYLEEDKNYNAHHAVEAYAVRGTYGHSWNHATITAVHASMADANPYFQGKMTGADVNKIKLGSEGDWATGTNVGGNTYRIIAKKYSTVQTLP